MVGVEDIDDDLRDEIVEECSNYGSVLRVMIHVTSETCLNPQSVRIFVQFDRSDDALYACDALNQRYFAGRLVNARLYDEESFQLHKLED